MKRILLALLAASAFVSAQAETSCSIGTPCAFPAGVADLYFNSASDGSDLQPGTYSCLLSKTSGNYTSATAVAYTGGADARFTPITLNLAQPTPVAIKYSQNHRKDTSKNDGSLSLNNLQIKFELTSINGKSIQSLGGGTEAVKAYKTLLTDNSINFNVNCTEPS